nr:unnamed protein product [Digitaria exilis]
MATKHFDTATSCQSSAVKKRPITREGAQKHADVVTTLRRPSTAERSSIVRDVAPRNATALYCRKTPDF